MDKKKQVRKYSSKIGSCKDFKSVFFHHLMEKIQSEVLLFSVTDVTVILKARYPIHTRKNMLS